MDEKVQQVAEHAIMAVSSNGVVSTTIISTFFATISGFATKENIIFILSAILILTQIIANLYKRRLYKKLSEQEHIPIDPDDVDEVISKRLKKKVRKG